MIVLITGATSGFGLATARRFAQNENRLIILGRRNDRLEAIAKELPNTAVHPICCDVRDSEKIKTELGALPPEFKDIDVLINNAGLALGTEPAHQARLEEWEQMVDTNIKGLLSITHAVLPGMVERKNGLIVNLGSTAAHYPYPGGNTYGGTKAFVRQFGLNLRADLLGTGVRVTCLEPGMCDQTEFSEVRFRGDRQKADAVYNGVTAISANDIAETIYWIVQQPKHININSLELMPVQQAFAPFAVHRE